MHGDSSYPLIYAAAQRGDRGGVEGILARVEPTTARYLERHIGAALRRFVDPQDVWQQTAMAVVRRIATWPADLTEDELQAYVLQVARRRIVDAARRVQRLRGESAEPSRGVGHRGRTGEVTRADELRQLSAAIDNLPAAYSRILRRCVLEGASVIEVAEELGLAPDNVRQRLHRGRAALRGALRDSGR